MMRKVMVCIVMCLGSLVGFAANNNFSTTNGDWDVAANWSLGNVPTTSDYAIIGSLQTAVVQSGVTANPQRLGIGYKGSVEVLSGAVMDTSWNQITIGAWFGNGGTLKVLGGTCGTAAQMERLYLGASNSAYYGNFEVGTGDTGGAVIFKDLIMYAPTDGSGTSAVTVNSGTLNVNNFSINGGDAVSDNAKVIVNGGTFDVAYNWGSLGGYTMEINGSSADINIGGYANLSAYTDVNFNFDDNGITSLDVTGPIYTGFHVDINIEGTESVPSGIYTLITARDASTLMSRSSFNINTNSFGGSEVSLIFDDSDGVTLSLQVVASLEGYDLWSSNYALSGDAADDDDGDGLSNVYEYGLGGDPTNSASLGTLPTLVVSNGVASYTHLQRTDSAAGIVYTVEQTTDLVNESWTNAGWSAVTTNATGDTDFDAVTYEIDDGNQRFIHLNITQ